MMLAIPSKRVMLVVENWDKKVGRTVSNSFRWVVDTNFRSRKLRTFLMWLFPIEIAPPYRDDGLDPVFQVST